MKTLFWDGLNKFSSCPEREFVYKLPQKSSNNVQEGSQPVRNEIKIDKNLLRLLQKKERSQT